MPNFLENIWAQLQRSTNRVVLREIHGERLVSVTGAELLGQVQHANKFSPLQSSTGRSLRSPRPKLDPLDRH
jgi:hypothetical protein